MTSCHRHKKSLSHVETKGTKKLWGDGVRAVRIDSTIDRNMYAVMSRTKVDESLFHEEESKCLNEVQAIHNPEEQVSRDYPHEPRMKLDEDKKEAKRNENKHKRTKQSSTKSSQHHKEYRNMAQKDEPATMKEGVLLEKKERIRGTDPPGHVHWSNPNKLWASNEDGHAAQGLAAEKRIDIEYPHTSDRVVSVSKGPAKCEQKSHKNHSSLLVTTHSIDPNPHMMKRSSRNLPGRKGLQEDRGDIASLPLKQTGRSQDRRRWPDSPESDVASLPLKQTGHSQDHTQWPDSPESGVASLPLKPTGRIQDYGRRPDSPEIGQHEPLASKAQCLGEVKSDSSATIEISDAPNYETPHGGAFAVSGIDLETGDDILDGDKNGAKSHNQAKYTHKHTYKTQSSLESSQHHKDHQDIAQRDEVIAMKELVLIEEREKGTDRPVLVPWSNANKLQVCREDRHNAQGTSGGQRMVSSVRSQGTSPITAALDSQGGRRPFIFEETRPGAVVVPGIDDDGGYEEQSTVAICEESTVHIVARVVDMEEENWRLREQDRILRERNHLLHERDRLLQMMGNAVVVSPVVVTDRNVEDGNEQVAGQKVERKKAGDPLHLLRQSHDVLHAWKDIYKVEKDNADAAYSHAKQLCCEDAAKRAHGKGKVYGREWTVKHFDQEMERLKNKQEPVWDTLITKVDGIHKHLEGSHRDVKATHERVKESLRAHPLRMLLANEGDMFSRTINLRHEYQDKLQQQYKQAETEFKLLCAQRNGTLARVKLLRENYLKENTRMLEYVHNQKGLVHEECRTPAEKKES